MRAHFASSFVYMNKLIHWLENHMLQCFYKKYVGIDCPGCGMQRSFIELLKGNITLSFKLYPALIPLLVTFIFTFLHLIFSFKNGAAIIKYSFIITVAVMVISYVIKMFF